MGKRDRNILSSKNRNEILSIVERLGSRPLTKTGHGFKDFGSVPIRQAAEASVKTFTDKWKEKPALGLISVVLAANRNYNKVVEPNLARIEEIRPDLKTFKHLETLLQTITRKEFYEFWGHKNKKKYETLMDMLAGFDSLNAVYSGASNDFDLVNKWAVSADVQQYKNDIIGSIPNVGLATFQHLRMVFGVDTVKPDQRVKEVLRDEFNIEKLSSEEAITVVEQIAGVLNVQVIFVDQIFVKYGSSYYTQRPKKLSVKEVARNLKALGVSAQIIKKATLLSFSKIERL